MKQLWMTLVLLVSSSVYAAEVSKEVLVSTFFDKQYNCTANVTLKDKHLLADVTELVLSQDGKIYVETKMFMKSPTVTTVENYMVVDKTSTFRWQIADGNQVAKPFKKPFDKVDVETTMKSSPSKSYTCSDMPPDTSKLTPPSSLKFVDAPSFGKKKK